MAPTYPLDVSFSLLSLALCAPQLGPDSDTEAALSLESIWGQRVGRGPVGGWVRQEFAVHRGQSVGVSELGQGLPTASLMTVTASQKLWAGWGWAEARGQVSPRCGG